MQAIRYPYQNVIAGNQDLCLLPPCYLDMIVHIPIQWLKELSQQQGHHLLRLYMFSNESLLQAIPFDMHVHFWSFVTLKKSKHNTTLMDDLIKQGKNYQMLAHCKPAEHHLELMQQEFTDFCFTYRQITTNEYCLFWDGEGNIEIYF